MVFAFQVLLLASVSIISIVNAVTIPRTNLVDIAKRSTVVSCPASNGTLYTASSGKSYLLQCYDDHAAGDLSMVYVSTYAACVDSCDSTSGCVAFSWNSGSNGYNNPCYMKSSIGADQVNSGIWGGKFYAAASSSSSRSSSSVSSSISVSTTGAGSRTSSSSSSSPSSSTTTRTTAASSTSVSSSISVSTTGAGSRTSSSVSTVHAAASSTPITCPGDNGSIFTAGLDTYLVECFIDHQAGDLGRVAVSTLNDCINACESTTGCIDVSWNPGTPGNCYMKSVVGAAFTNTLVWGGLKQSRTTGASLSSTATTSSSSLTLTSTSSVPTTALPTITSTSSVPTTSKATSTTPTTSTTSTTSAASATSTLSCPAANGTIFTAPNGLSYVVACYQDGNANDLSFQYTVSLDACLDLCSTTTGCTAVSWVPGNPGPCYMKTAFVNPNYNTGVWGGYLLSAATTSTSSSTKTSSSSSLSSSLTTSSSSSIKTTSTSSLSSSSTTSSSSSVPITSTGSTISTTSSTSLSTSSSASSSTSSSTSTSTSSSTVCGTPEATPYWLDQMQHQGVATFNSNSSYQVYRNVKCFGAKGDGVTDDTVAINNAIASSNRCGSGCTSSTTQPAVVYFPGGNYVITGPILALYYTELVGNPNNVPHIIGRGDFQGVALIDANPYYGSTNNFYRSIRNFVLDTTQIPGNQYGTGIHWQVAQATSLQNIRFEMSTVAGNVHQGLYGEDGSGGFMSDLTFNNGKYGMYMGNQQFTARNMIFNNQNTIAIYLSFAWSWTFKSVQINNVPVGLDISMGGGTGQAISSALLLDSSFTNVPIGVNTARNSSSQTPAAAGTLAIENLLINNVPVVVKGGSSTNLAGTTGSTTINYGQGHEYIPGAQGVYFQSAITPKTRPSSLLSGGKYLEKSKPTYQNNVASDFVSVRSIGAKGDGVTDDTAALNSAFASGKIVFVDHGVYLVRGTLFVPPGARIVGECWPRIMADGSSSVFSNMASPQPMIQVGTPGQSGLVEISDLIVQSKGPAPGVILIEWNLASSSTANPSGMWDVHATVGGTAGTNLELAQCPTTAAQPATACIGAFMLVHISKSANGVYLENTWLWTADHQVENDPNQTQITVFTGRGLLIESTAGPTWLYGTASEHNVMYQYQLSNTANVFAGLIQTETPYFQANPPAPAPFVTNTAYNDPNFATICASAASVTACEKAFGLRIVSSDQALVYGAGLYSFFENYSTSCLGTTSCQTNIVSIENEGSEYVLLYNLNTIGTTNMIIVDGVPVALAANNVGTFPDTIAYYRNN